MKTIVTAAILAVGFAVGGATANAQTNGDQPTSVIEHHSTAHNIGPCGLSPCPRKPATHTGC